MNGPAYLSCSSCGQEFLIEDRTDGFSHCDRHTGYQPLNEDALR